MGNAMQAKQPENETLVSAKSVAIDRAKRERTKVGVWSHDLLVYVRRVDGEGLEKNFDPVPEPKRLHGIANEEGEWYGKGPGSMNLLVEG